MNTNKTTTATRTKKGGVRDTRELPSGGEFFPVEGVLRHCSHCDKVTANAYGWRLAGETQARRYYCAADAHKAQRKTARTRRNSQR